MYNITVENPEPMKDGEDSEKYQKRLYVWQNSWGLTTRSIGVMMLTHGDDKGAVIPPRVAEIQAILLPVGVTAKTSAEDKDKLYKAASDIENKLLAADIRVEKDVRDNYSAGWKFAQYELQGIPVRLELGPRDLASEQVVAVRRDTGDKTTLPFASLEKDLSTLLEKMQNDMLERARKAYDEHRKVITSFDDIVPALNAKNVVLIPSCLDGKCCDAVKDETAAKSKADKAASTEAEDAQAPSMGAKALCIPFEQDGIGKLPETCIRPGCGKPAQKWVQFGRSY